MKLKFIASAAALLACMTVSAAKPTLYINEFENSAKTKDAWVGVVRGAILEGINNTKRTTIVDAKTESTRFEEELRRLQDNISTENGLDATQELQTRGAHAIISGDVTSLSTNGTKLDSGTMSYDASITVSLSVVNALDGAVLATKSFTFTNEMIGGIGGLLKNSGKNEDEAVQNTKKNIVKAMKNFVDEAFPIVGTVESVETVKKGKEVETFYVGIGSEDGVVKGNKLDIKIEQQIGKRKALKTIGECEVIEVAGDDISLCKVKKGGEEMKKAIDGDQTVVVTTKSK